MQGTKVLIRPQLQLKLPSYQALIGGFLQEKSEKAWEPLES